MSIIIIIVRNLDFYCDYSCVYIPTLLETSCMKKFGYRFSLLPFVIIAIVLNCLSSQAQNNDVGHDRKLLDSLLISEHLDTLRGLPVTLYSHGYTTRARAIQALVRSCIEFYKNQYPGDHYEVQIEILNEKDWKTLPFPQPYGFPHFTDVNQSIIVSADKNALNKLNKMDDQGTSDSTTAGYDFVALHELGHYFFFTLHQIDREHWLNEMLASYFMICYLKEKKLTLDIGKENPSFSPKHRTLADFESLYFRVGPQNYDWYQRRFIDLGYSLYPPLKTTLIQKVLTNYGKDGKKADGLSFIKSVAPATMEAWLKVMQ